MILTIMFWLIMGVFFIKISWNFSLAYLLLWELLIEKRPETEGVSIMPSLEFLALGGMVVVSVLLGGEMPVFGHRSVAFIGLALIVASYIHLFLIGSVGGYIASKIK